jgi:methylated-DNA-protein-cysteine methyltransferase-like protein
LADFASVAIPARLDRFRRRRHDGSLMPKSDSMFAVIRATIRKIPRGKVATYGDVAYAAGFPGAARQVVWALHGSGGLLPWQRVVGAGGKILLPGVKGAEQRFLLQSEGVAFIGLRVDMKHHRLAWPMFRRKRRKPQRTRRTPRSSER